VRAAVEPRTNVDRRPKEDAKNLSQVQLKVLSCSGSLRS